LQFGPIADYYRIGPMLNKAAGQRSDSVSQKNGRNRGLNLISQFPGLAQQFEAHFVQHTFALFGKHPNSAS
jgi:hypothetical protein